MRQTNIKGNYLKYVFTENTQEAHEAEDAVVELEYNDLLTKLDKTDFDCTKTVKARSFASLVALAIISCFTSDSFV